MPFQHVTLKITTSNPDYEDLILHELEINKRLLKDSSVAGFAFVRAAFDNFITIGPTGAAHLCLVFEAMREPLSQFQHASLVIGFRLSLLKYTSTLYCRRWTISILIARSSIQVYY